MFSVKKMLLKKISQNSQENTFLENTSGGYVYNLQLLVLLSLLICVLLTFYVACYCHDKKKTMKLTDFSLYFQETFLL